RPPSRPPCWRGRARRGSSPPRPLAPPTGTAVPSWSDPAIRAPVCRAVGWQEKLLTTAWLQGAPRGACEEPTPPVADRPLYTRWVARQHGAKQSRSAPAPAGQVRAAGGVAPQRRAGGPPRPGGRG